MCSICQLNGFNYKSNPDKIVNKHGKRLLEICQDDNLLLLTCRPKEVPFQVALPFVEII